MGLVKALPKAKVPFCPTVPALYKGWVDEQVALAVSEGGSEVTLPGEKSAELIASVKGKWDEEVNAACGDELAGNIRGLLESHAQN